MLAGSVMSAFRSSKRLEQVASPQLLALAAAIHRLSAFALNLDTGMNHRLNLAYFETKRRLRLLAHREREPRELLQGRAAVGGGLA